MSLEFGEDNFLKLAFVYDRVNKWGGAERVLLALHEIWPKAPLFTAVYDPEKAPWAEVFKVIPSFLNKFPLAQANHEFYPWLMPLAFESFDFSDYELVISITSEAAKGVITRPETLHLCYCLTPTRYLWSGYNQYFSSPVSQLLSWPAISYLRAWDKVAAQRPDLYLATCRNVQKRIKKYYQRESEIIYPPVNTESFKVSKFQSFKAIKKNYFLIVSRLVSYKRIEIVIEAFNQLGLPLKIVGVGKQLNRLKKIAKNNIEFLGQLTDQQLLGYYQQCQAVIFPQEEDFGLVPLEAQACGKPVVAFKAGGVLETVIEGKTGWFFHPQTPTALVKAIGKFKKFKGLRVQDCRENAKKFGKEIFKKRFKSKVEEEWRNFRN